MDPALHLFPFNEQQLRKLHGNHVLFQANQDQDVMPVVRLLADGRPWQWIMVSLNLYEPTQAYGLVDLGLGDVELCAIDLSELAKFRGPFGERIVLDMFWKPQAPLSAFVDDVVRNGRLDFQLTHRAVPGSVMAMRHPA